MKHSRCTDTVHQGLSMGIPVVTLPAKFIRGRFALAMYRQMSYTDLVAADLEVHDLRYHVVVTVSSAYPASHLAWHSPLYEYSPHSTTLIPSPTSNRNTCRLPSSLGRIEIFDSDLWRWWRKATDRCTSIRRVPTNGPRFCGVHFERRHTD